MFEAFTQLLSLTLSIYMIAWHLDELLDEDLDEDAEFEVVEGEDSDSMPSLSDSNSSSEVASTPGTERGTISGRGTSSGEADGPM